MNNVLYESLYKYYSDDKNIDKFNSCINGENKISLRIIDWFVTNFAKKNNIEYYVMEPQKSKIVKKSYADNFIKN